MICPIPRRLRTHPTSITSTYPGVVHPGVQRAEPADGIHAIAEPAAGGEGPSEGCEYEYWLRCAPTFGGGVTLEELAGLDPMQFHRHLVDGLP